VPHTFDPNSRLPPINVRLRRCARTLAHTAARRANAIVCRRLQGVAGDEARTRYWPPLCTPFRVSQHLARPRTLAPIAAALSFACLMLAPAGAGAQRADADAVKAAFLYNFSKFVEWPGAVGPRFTIGVVGSDRVADALTAIVRGKSADGQPLAVIRVTPQDDFTTLQMLFIGASEAGRMAAIVKKAGRGVLTVSDADRFCPAGGMIEFRNDDDRVRFDIELHHAEAAGLAISSKLLALARTVYPSRSRKDP
jgi:hypothetical protein